MANRPVVAIIGRPNVGKSSLFNRLLKRRQAIVSPVSGTTRDRIYTPIQVGDFTVDLVDTAGLSKDLDSEVFGAEMLEQVQLAVQEADVLIFVLDAHAGLTSEDQKLAEIIRKASTPTIVYINKVDNKDLEDIARTIDLGLGVTVTGSITQRKGHTELLGVLEQVIKDAGLAKAVNIAEPHIPRIALVGRPNVGKSTLLNALAGYDRVIVSDIAGTTRDTIDTQIELSNGEKLIIVDTAGIRRRGKVGAGPKVERYSVMRSHLAIDEADLVLLLIDASEGLTRGDAHVADYALKQNKRLITVINKSDLINPESFNWRRFPFLTKHPLIFISAKDQTFIPELLEQVSLNLRKVGETLTQSS